MRGQLRLQGMRRFGPCKPRPAVGGAQGAWLAYAGPRAIGLQLEAVFGLSKACGANIGNTAISAVLQNPLRLC